MSSQNQYDKLTRRDIEIINLDGFEEGPSEIETFDEEI